MNGFIETLETNGVNVELVFNAIIDTLYMLFVAGFFTFIFGFALGLVLYLTDHGGLMENRFVNRVLSFLINVLRSIPFIVLLVIMMPVTKAITGKVIGIEAAIPTLIVAMAPFVARIIHLALTEVPPGVIEAAKSMGASNGQIVRKFLFPEAKPAIISGTTIASVTLLSNTAVAGVTVGAGGLGQLAISSYNQYQYWPMWAATLLLTVIVFSIQIPGDHYARVSDKR